MNLRRKVFWEVLSLVEDSLDMSDTNKSTLQRSRSCKPSLIKFDTTILCEEAYVALVTVVHVSASH